MAARPELAFATSVPTQSFDTALKRAQAAEDAGFDAVVFGDRPQDPVLEGWTVATAIAARTERVRLFHTTLNLPYRYPQLIAKQAATLDNICGGRFDLCLGAGGTQNQPYYEQYGIPFHTAGERLQALREAFAIIRGLWTSEKFSYQGRYYQVKDAVCEPKPVRGTIPIWTGALLPKAMALAGELADGWMKNHGWADLDEYRALNQRIDEVAKGAGRDPSSIRRIIRGPGLVAKDPAEAEEARRETPQGLIGTVQEILDTLQAYREAGADTFIVEFRRGPDSEQMLRTFGAEVIPAARQLATPV